MTDANYILPQSVWIMGLVVAVAYGVCIGSFLNVVIWRLPRGGSIATPTWSYCPSCQHRLSVADLIPLASFLALGRRCRYCREPISWRYFTVEALTGVGFLAVFWRYLTSWNVVSLLNIVFYVLFLSVLIAVLFIDLDCFIIPDELSLCAFLIGVARNVFLISQHQAGQFTLLLGIHWPNSLVAAVVCALIFHFISLAGYLYYSSRAGKPAILRRSAAFLVGIADDYVYLAAKFLGLGYLSPAIRGYISRHEEIPETGSDEKSREEIASAIENDEEQTGMGQGDAKLAAAIGANLYLTLSLVSFFLSIIIGGIIGIALLLSRKAQGRSAIPFGPYLVLGAVVALLFGQNLLSWYVNYLHIA
ncbi:MAG TPA: prepilin peptidase [Capsulimonadaceae bacterium]|nr:prepilin peptidase [Capsulimonadaceae bacterium]